MSALPQPPSASTKHEGRALTILVAASSSALLAPLLFPLFTGRVFVYNDLSWFHLPLRYVYQQALNAGDTVLWTPSIFAGMYLHGEGQIGLFHPFHQLLYRLLPLATAFNLELVASYPATFAGMFWFLRRLQFSQAEALFGAMLFAFSGFNVLHHHHMNMVAIVAHLPWLLVAADVLIADEGTRRRAFGFGGIAVILGSEFLLGFPQGVWWNVMTLAAFGVLRAGERRQWRRLLPCVAAVLVGVLLGGIQLLPTADTAAHSTRMELSRQFALTYSLHPYNLFQLWSPYFFERGAYSVDDYMWFHDFGIYSGAILPVAAIWVCIRRRALRARWGLIIAALLFAGVALVLALGRYGGVATLLTHLPGLQSFRAPVRYIVLAQFALAIVAAIAFDDLRAIVEGRSAPSSGRLPALWIPTALGIITTLALNGRLLPYGKHSFASAAQAAPGVAILAAVTLLVYLAGRRVRWALSALIVVTAMDLGLWGIRFVYREPARTIAALTEGVAPAPADPADAYAAAPTRGPYQHNLLVMRGYRLTSGYAGLYPASRHPLDSDVALRLAGTRWSIAPDGVRHPFEGGVQRARLLNQDQQGQPTGSARLAVDRTGHLDADVTTPVRATLALTERFHDGWSATIDGAPSPIVRVEGDFLGCVVDPGVHRVSLRFMPRSFVYGAITSAIGVVLLAAVLIVWLR